MIFQMSESLDCNERIYTLKVRGHELARARLQHFDRLLIADCEASDKVSDKILALETIARRIEESAALDGSTKREGQ